MCTGKRQSQQFIARQRKESWRIAEEHVIAEEHLITEHQVSKKENVETEHKEVHMGI